jgi:hypothetical protein
VDPNLPAPSPLTLSLLIAAGPQRNWAGFDELIFRVSADADLTSTATISGSPLPDFSVVVEDATGTAVSIPSTDPGLPVATRRPVFHQGVTGPGPAFENLSALRLETVRIPLSLLTGIDRANIAKVSIAPSANFARHMFFDSFQLVRF